jgi:hypothetical protein
MAKKKEVETTATATTTEKPKITVVWFRENEDYYNSFFYFSNSKEALDRIRKDLDTNGDVWDKEEYPLICKKIMKIHNSYFAANDYFFFRGMHDNETDVRVEEDVCQDLVDAFKNEQLSLLHTNHENKFAALHAKMIVQGVCQDYEFADPIIVTFTEIDRLGI